MSKKEEQLGLEKAFSELERITANLQSDSLDLEAAIEQFERGLLLSQRLKARLGEIENKIETIRLKFSASSEKDALGEE